MKKCVYCGADLEDQAAFCTRCGKPAGEENGSAPSGSQGQPSGMPYAPGPGYYGGPVPGRYNGMAIASLVLGIVGIFFNGLYLVPSILAIIFGILGRSQIRRDPSQRGMGMATAGLVLGIVFLVLYLLVIILMLAAWRQVASELDWTEILEVLEHLGDM